MLLQLFKSKNPLLLGLTVLVTLSLWIKTFLNSSITNLLEFEMPLFGIFYQFINFYQLKLIIAVLFLLFQVLFLIRFNNKYKVLHENYFLQALIFSLIVNSITSLQNLFPIYIANLLFMYSFDKIVKSINAENAIPHYFEASFYISLASLFYFNIIFYFIIIWIGLIIIRPIIWREWFVSIIGLVLPYFFIVTYYFIFDDSNFKLFTKVMNCVKFGFTQSNFTFISVVIISFSSFISLLQLLKKSSLSISNRKIKILFTWIIVISFLLFLFTNNESLQLIFVFAFAATFFITNYLVEIKRQWIGNIILLVFIGVNVYAQFFMK